jgi:hypothetical protein
MVPATESQRVRKSPMGNGRRLPPHAGFIAAVQALTEPDTSFDLGASNGLYRLSVINDPSATT